MILRQKEFGNKENKRKKKELERKLAGGKKATNESIRDFRKDLREGAQFETTVKTNTGGKQRVVFNQTQQINPDYSRYTQLDHRISKRGAPSNAASGGAKVFISGYENNNIGKDIRRRAKEEHERIEQRKQNSISQTLLNTSSINTPNPSQPKSTPKPNAQSVQQVANNTKQKTSGFIKKAWNGEVGKLGKTGNRALMIGVPTLAVAGGGTALALRKKNNKKETK